MIEYRLENGKLVKVKPEHEQQFLQNHPTATLASGNQQSSAKDASTGQKTSASESQSGDTSSGLELLGKNVTNSYSKLDSINTTLKRLKSSMDDAKAFNNEVVYNSLAEEYNNKIDKYKSYNTEYTEAIKLYKVEETKQVNEGTKVKTDQENREESSFISDIFSYIPNALLPPGVIAAKGLGGSSWLGDTIKRGWSQAADTGEAADIILGGADIDLQTVSDWVKANEDKAKNYKESEKMLRFMKKYEAEGRTWTSFFKNVKEEPSLMAELLIQSYATMAGTAWDSPEALATAGLGAGAGAGAGAAATFYGFGVGAIPGGVAGFMGGLAVSMEASLTLGELVREELEREGKEFNDENVLALMQSEIGTSIRNKAVGRGLAIGAVEALTGGLAGRTTTTVLKAGAKVAAKSTVKGAAVKVGSMAGGIGVEAVGGGLGEVAGRLVAGQEMDKAEIGFEAVTGTATAPLNVGLALKSYKKPSYKLNGEIIAYDKMKDFIDTATEEDIAKADINIENDLSGLDKIALEKQNKFYTKTQIDPRVSDKKDVDQLVALEIKLQEVNQKTQSGKNRAKAIKEQIKEITDKYSDVDITTDEVVQKRTNRSEVQKARRENKLNATIKFAEEQGKLIGKETIVAENDADAQVMHDKAIEEWNAKNPDNKIGANDVAGADGFIVGDVIIINKDVASKTGAINVGAHELLHGIMAKQMEELGVEGRTKLMSDFKNTITKDQFNYIEKRIKENYKAQIDADPNWINQTDEWVTIFSDGIKQGDITFNEGVFMKLAQFIQNIARKFGYNKEFQNGRQVYNFLKDYQASVDKGQLSKRAIDLASSETSVTETKKSVSDAKGPIDKLGKIDSDGNDLTEPGVGNFLYQAEVDQVISTIKEEGYLDNLIASKYKVRPVPQDFVQDVLAELTPHIQAFKPESNDSLFGWIQGQISNKAGNVYNKIYKDKGPAKTVDIDATTSEGAPLVQIEADTSSEMSAIDRIGLTDIEVEQRSKLRRDIRLDSSMMQVVRDAVIKTFGTKLPDVSSKKFRVALEKAFRTELKKPLQDLMGGRLEYDLFLRNHSKAIIKALPVETLVQMERNLKPEQRIFTESRRITKSTEVDKLVSEGRLPKDTSRTSGPQLHTKKPFPGIDKVMAYFRGKDMETTLGYKVGASTLGTRKDKLAMELGVELAFDATSEVVQDPAIAEKRKMILELQGIEQLDNDLAMIAKQIDRNPNIKFSSSSGSSSVIKNALGIKKENVSSFIVKWPEVLNRIKSDETLADDKKGLKKIIKEVYSDLLDNTEINSVVKNIVRYSAKYAERKAKTKGLIDSDISLHEFIHLSTEADVIDKSITQFLSSLLPGGYNTVSAYFNDKARIKKARATFATFVTYLKEDSKLSESEILRLLHTQYKGMYAGNTKIGDGRFGVELVDGVYEIVTIDTSVEGMSDIELLDLANVLKLSTKELTSRDVLIKAIKTKLRTDHGSLLDFSSEKSPAKKTLKEMSDDELINVAKLMSSDTMRPVQVKLNEFILAGKKYFRNDLIKAIELQRTKKYSEGVNKVLDIIIKQKSPTHRGQVTTGVNDFWRLAGIKDYKAKLAKIDTKTFAERSSAAVQDKNYEGRLKQAKEARKAVEMLMEFYIGKIKDSNSSLDWGDLLMLAKMLGSSMNSPMKRAANLAYIAEGVENIRPDEMGALTEYEHMIPTSVKILEMIVAYVNHGKLPDTFWGNYEIAIVPKTMDKVLTKNGLRDFMPLLWQFEDANWRRYYNKQTLGEPNLVPLVSIKTGEVGKVIGADFVKASDLLHAQTVDEKIAQIVGKVSVKYSKSKGASIWDFDDTLARTQSGVRYTLPNPSGEPQPGRKVIFLAGGAGSGKSGVVKSLGLEAQGFKIVNQDISLEWLKKNAGLPTDMRDLTPEQLSEVNKLAGEARRIAKRKQGKFKGNGDGVIIDGTGGSLNVIKKKVQEFKDAGYDVQMIFVDTSLDVALERNKSRKERSLGDIIVKQNHKAVQGNKEGFKELFGDRFAEVNTDKLSQTSPMPKTLTNKVNDFVSGYIKARLEAGEFAHKGAELKEQGAEFDFAEFSMVKDGKQGPLFQDALARAKKYGTKDQFVLTARPMAAAPHIQEFLKSQGLDIPLENITGLESSTAESKALWVAQKVAEGYNDIYFADDALQNVKAVDNILKEFDIKSEVVQAKIKFSKSGGKDFNEMLERTTGVGKHKEFSGATAQLRGANVGRFKFFVPPSAEDFKGLLYSFLGKGKQGDADMAFFKEHLLDPFAAGIRNINGTKQKMSDEYSTLKKSFPKVVKGLGKKVGDTNFTTDNAIRVYLWNKAEFKVPGLSKLELDNLVEHVESNEELRAFADVLSRISRMPKGYIKPGDYWLTESIASDLHNVTSKINRSEFLAEWVENKDIIFSEQNLNKIEAVYGTSFREALEDILFRMEKGTNRSSGNDKIVSNFQDWINGSVGAVMFFNTRSAVLQTLSTVNFLDWNDNNIFQAAKAFANQKQYWTDFVTLYNSDMLKQRRSGMQLDVNMSELMESVSTANVADKSKAAIRYLLQIGFTPTQIADSFAISAGGATFYRNKVKKYLKEGMNQKDAETKAFDEFQEIAEETQQSSRPDLISQQQAGTLGRLILAWANTPMQYTRLTKKAISDLANGRGDWRSHVSRIIYYGAAQNFIFSSLQTGLAFLLFGDDEEEEAIKTKEIRVANGMMDTLLRGTGIYGAMVSTLKNTIIQWDAQRKKGYGRQDWSKVVLDIISLSPPIGSKVRKVMNAIKTYEYNKGVPEKMGWRIDNPILSVIGNIVESTTNFPLDRLVRKANNIDEAITGQHELWQKVALMLGWNTWSIGIKDEDLEKAKAEVKEERKEKKAEDKKAKKEETKKAKEAEKKKEEEAKKAEGFKSIRCSGIKSNGKRCSIMVETKAKSAKCSFHKAYKPNESSDRDNDGVKEYQCKSLTGSGKRCKNRTENTSKKCYAHQ